MPPVNRNKPINAESSDSRYTLMDFMREFPDDATCLEWLWRNRYSPDGEHAYCTKCETDRVFKRYGTSQQRQSWTCNGCGHHLHPTAGTIYHKSSTSLHLWFYGMFLMTSTRCGISAKQLEREIGVNYKTAARMMKKIRNDLMPQDDSPMGGTLEADETYVGGRRRESKGGKRGRPGPGSHKVPVFGVVERGGRVMAVTVPNVRRVSLMPHVERRVLPASTIYTDELRSYNGLTGAGYRHDRVNHSEQVYVSGDVHTNTIEGFWSLMKRGIGGVYHCCPLSIFRATWTNTLGGATTALSSGRSSRRYFFGRLRRSGDFFGFGGFAVALRFHMNSPRVGTGISYPCGVFCVG